MRLLFQYTLLLVFTVVALAGVMADDAVPNAAMNSQAAGNTNVDASANPTQPPQPQSNPQPNVQSNPQPNPQPKPQHQPHAKAPKGMQTNAKPQGKKHHHSNTDQPSMGAGVKGEGKHKGKQHKQGEKGTNDGEANEKMKKHRKQQPQPHKAHKVHLKNSVCYCHEVDDNESNNEEDEHHKPKKGTKKGGNRKGNDKSKAEKKPDGNMYMEHDAKKHMTNTNENDNVHTTGNVQAGAPSNVQMEA